MIKDLKDNRGIALIITISIIGLIVILTLRFNNSMRTELHAAANLYNGIGLKYIGRSGFNCAMAVLREDDSATDSLNDSWASLKEYSSYSAALFESGLFEAEIVDLAGKIQINQLVGLDGEYNTKQKDLLIRLLTSTEINVEMDEAEDILDAVKDWIDEDNEVTRFGAEDSFYQTLESPYYCRNGTLESLDELLLIKGITSELFYGTEDNPGISSYLTIYGDGRVNINTADSLVLKSLSEDMDQEMVEEIMAYREDDENELTNASWYKTALGTNEDIIDMGLITTKSLYFEIISIAVKDSMSREIKGTVKRDGKVISILSWKTL
ncbi:general secretion pathway protein GspK [Deltaproteobacteria bacterium]|nr:general secretion pathway protein GspK [Deltaproteobacteria bacterium]